MRISGGVKMNAGKNGFGGASWNGSSNPSNNNVFIHSGRWSRTWWSTGQSEPQVQGFHQQNNFQNDQYLGNNQNPNLNNSIFFQNAKANRNVLNSHDVIDVTDSSRVVSNNGN